MGVDTITGCVKTIGKKVIERLGKQLGCECLMDELIRHDKQVDYLRDWIVIRERVIQEKENQSHENNVIEGQPMSSPMSPQGQLHWKAAGTSVSSGS